MASDLVPLWQMVDFMEKIAKGAYTQSGYVSLIATMGKKWTTAHPTLAGAQDRLDRASDRLRNNSSEANWREVKEAASVFAEQLTRMGVDSIG